MSLQSQHPALATVPDPNAPRPWWQQIAARRLAAVSYDLVAIVLAWLGALEFRFALESHGAPGAAASGALIWVLPLMAVIFYLMGLYRGIWRFASVGDLLRILRAVGLGGALVFLVVFFSGQLGAVPRSVLLLFPVFLVALMATGRLGWRAWSDGHHVADQGTPVLILGAGTAGVSLARQLQRSAEWRVVGFLDDSPEKQGCTVAGHEVLGVIDQAATIAKRLKVQHAILAVPSLPATRRAQVLRACVGAGLKARSVPGIGQLLHGEARLDELRDISLEDLIGRAPVEIDGAVVGHTLAGKRVLVTGAGGSIGSELCRQIARYQPAQIILLDVSEFALYQIDESLQEHFPALPRVPLTADVRDAAYVEELLARHRPDIVFHAAAYKHVPLMEQHNAWQAIRTNVYGTWVVANAAARLGVGKFVMVSTDKAVNPTNVMGASKRMAELVCLSLHAQFADTQFEIVRFGNVLGSAGSVIPKFQAQIAKGGPLTVTHPDITRYFMSIPEAAQLVLQAAAMGRGGEVFVLDMGEPLKVAEVARNLIRLSGRTEQEIPLLFTGLRPGEKLFEELLANDETTRKTHHPKVRIANTTEADPAWMPGVLQWVTAGNVGDEQVRAALVGWVPEYAPSSNNPCR